jgi:SAM-dependent methyltransferase
MRLIKFRLLADYEAYYNSLTKNRLLIEDLIAKKNVNNKTWDLIGYCEPCGKPSAFLIDWEYSNGVIPNYRERLLCEHCGLNNRQRFVASLLKVFLKNSNPRISDIYLFEQITTFYKYIKDNLKDLNVTGSEYLGYNRKSGDIIKGTRHEDALNLSFPDSSIDVIISNDVYEHVPDVRRALKEAHRILRLGGKLLVTIPFHPFMVQTKRRAVMENGEITHLLPEQYHGNPISQKGSLVFYDYGWDFLTYCIEAGFKDVYMMCYYSFLFGYLGDGLQSMFVAEK